MWLHWHWGYQTGDLMQKRRNAIANALGLRRFYIKRLKLFFGVSEVILGDMDKSAGKNKNIYHV